MNNSDKCNKYESIFVFGGDDAIKAHIDECPDCREEYEKHLKVSSLVKEVAPVYLKKQKQKRLSAVKRLACCFILLIGITGFTGYTGYKIYDANSFQVNTVDESYIGNLGLPTDEYGFLEI